LPLFIYGIGLFYIWHRFLVHLTYSRVLYAHVYSTRVYSSERLLRTADASLLAHGGGGVIHQLKLHELDRCVCVYVCDRCVCVCVRVCGEVGSFSTQWHDVLTQGFETSTHSLNAHVNDSGHTLTQGTHSLKTLTQCISITHQIHINHSTHSLTQHTH